MRERPALRRDDLIAAGIELLGSPGGPSLTVRAACRAAGMNDTLAKPIVPRELLAKILQWGQSIPSVERARRMA